MGAHSRVPTPAEMADRFADADADGSGTIDMDELQTILPVEYSRAQLETTFRKYDADGSGALGLDEFKMLVIDLERELISRELMDRGAKDGWVGPNKHSKIAFQNNPTYKVNAASGMPEYVRRSGRSQVIPVKNQPPRVCRITIEQIIRAFGNYHSDWQQTPRSSWRFRPSHEMMNQARAISVAGFLEAVAHTALLTANQVKVLGESIEKLVGEGQQRLVDDRERRDAQEEERAQAGDGKDDDGDDIAASKAVRREVQMRPLFAGSPWCDLLEKSIELPSGRWVALLQDVVNMRHHEARKKKRAAATRGGSGGGSEGCRGGGGRGGAKGSPSSSARETTIPFLSTTNVLGEPYGIDAHSSRGCTTVHVADHELNTVRVFRHMPRKTAYFHLPGNTEHMVYLPVGSTTASIRWVMTSVDRPLLSHITSFRVYFVCTRVAPPSDVQCREELSKRLYSLGADNSVGGTAKARALDRKLRDVDTASAHFARGYTPSFAERLPDSKDREFSATLLYVKRASRDAVKLAGMVTPSDRGWRAGFVIFAFTPQGIYLFH